MLLCVILVWPTKFENFLNLMKNVFKAWKFKKNWLKIFLFFLGKLGSKQVFFEKHFISYSCILFLNFNALRSFCRKLLCFSKICVFQIFNQLNLFFDWSKMQLKFWFEPNRFDRYSIGSRLIEGIFDQSNLIFDRSKIV